MEKYWKGDNMKNILIATRNKDKFKLLSKLLSTELLKDSKFFSLNDIEDEIEDKKEVGDIKNRSYEKAMNAYLSIKNNIYQYIIGIDDGIEMKGQMIENVKEYIKDILDDKYLKEDEIVYIKKAYTFIDKNGVFKTIVTKIPFKYKKLTNHFEIEENSYPLNHVLTPIDSNLRLVDIDEETTNNYLLTYSKEGFDEVEKFFND